jgi:hypothetical protein
MSDAAIRDTAAGGTATRDGGAAVRALREALLAEGGILGQHVTAQPPETPSSPGPAQVAASGPRARGREAEYELLIEMILEGALLHYGAGRAVAAADPDLALLLGDQLYALGLVRLTALGDLAAVMELADLISLVAQAQAAGDHELVEAAWDAAAVAIGWGTTPAHEHAKALARAGDPGATRALRVGGAPEVRFSS